MPMMNAHAMTIAHARFPVTPFELRGKVLAPDIAAVFWRVLPLSSPSPKLAVMEFLMRPHPLVPSQYSSSEAPGWRAAWHPLLSRP